MLMVYKFCSISTWENFLQSFYQSLLIIHQDFNQLVSLSTDGNTLNVFTPFNLIISFNPSKGVRYLQIDSNPTGENTDENTIESLDNQSILRVTTLFKIGKRGTSLGSWCGKASTYGATISPIFGIDGSDIYDITPADCCFYFTTIKDFYSEETSPAIFFPYATNLSDQNSIRDFNENFYNCVISLKHPSIEFINSQFFQAQKRACSEKAERIVLTPFLCKDIPYYAPHLFLKEINNKIAYGDLHIGNKFFFAGSFYAIET
jgi:hypothetical protein